MIRTAVDPPLAPGARRKKTASLRVAHFDDYEQIAAVEASNGLTTKTSEQWLALWLKNPAYAGLREWPIGWVIEDSDGRIVGSLGNVPTHFQFNGRKYVCAVGRGWAVDAEYRGFSVMLLARQLRQSWADLNVVTTPSPTTVELCSKLGWSRVPVGQWNRSAFWVTNYRRVSQSYLRAKASPPLSGPVGTLLSPALRLTDAFSRQISASRRYDELRWCEGFDERFEQFWKEREANSGETLLPVRDLETLRWHFDRILREKRLWILTACEGSRLVGYAILECRDTQALDLRRVLFIDVQTLSPDSKLRAAMTRCTLDRCRREGIDILENAGCWMEGASRAPFHRDLETWCYLYRAINPALEEPLRNPACWDPTQYDGDASW